MSAELVFESRQIYHVLRQDDGIEIAPLISLHLELTGGPKVYASDASLINRIAWSMTIRRGHMAPPRARRAHGRLIYAAEAEHAQCLIEVRQSAERYAALLEMFKGGRASEITILVDGLADAADYSKIWDTDAHRDLAIRSICFEFPLPQSEA